MTKEILEHKFKKTENLLHDYFVTLSSKNYMLSIKKINLRSYL